MENSYVRFLRDCYLALLRDCEAAYPQLADEWSRDRSRLLSTLETRGTQFFTVDLPAFGKHFDRCLDEGILTRSGLPHQRPYSNRVVIPRLFRGLLLRVFEPNGKLRSDVDKRAILFLRSLYMVAKKLKMECPDAATFEAVSEFVSIEETIRRPSFHWDSDTVDFGAPGFVSLRDLHRDTEIHSDLFGEFRTDGSSTPIVLLESVQRVADRLTSGFGPVEHRVLRPKHGPGAVADLRLGSESKYSFPTWPAKLDRVFPVDEFAFANLSLWEEAYESARSRGELSHHEAPSRLISVPKTQKGPRLIAAEPTSHQWIQGGLQRELEACVRRSPLHHCIDFRSQEASRTAALRASESGLLCTIDLSSASDRLSCWTVERIFRANASWLEAFHACRTRWLVNNIDKKRPKYLVLRKFSTQGSALTFPVQSIVYAIVAIGVVIHNRGWSVDRTSIDAAARQVRIFGDDIIIPKDCFGDMVKVLTDLGLKVNMSKSYAKGLFRESCGMDAYAGVDVTPVYVRQPYKQSRPESLASVVMTHNNLTKRRMWHMASWLKSTVPPKVRKLIPEVSEGSGVLGWVSYGDADATRLKSRWNTATHQMEYRVIDLLAKIKRAPTRGEWSLHQYFTESPSPDLFWTAGVDSRPRLNLRARWVPAERLAEGHYLNQ